jgi:hypothetical protein
VIRFAGAGVASMRSILLMSMDASRTAGQLPARCSDGCTRRPRAKGRALVAALEG